MSIRIADTERSERILSGRLQLLFHNIAAIITNLVIAGVVTFLLWPTFPDAVLVVWLTATFIVCVARVVLERRYHRSAQSERSNRLWAHRFTLGALVSGLLWGTICLGLPVWGSWHEYVLMTIVVAGMSAGALATISPHLPAYLSYTTSVVLPMACVSIASPDRYVAGGGVMMLVYLVAISITAKRGSDFVRRTIELKVDNEMLQESLKRTRIERDVARTEKWSTLAQLSHELRTPLNAILGFSEAMHQEFFGPIGNARYKDYAGHVLESGRHLLRLIEQLLQLSQGESGELTLDESEVDVAKVIQNLIDVMGQKAQDAGLSLAARVPYNLPLLKADKTKLHQMLLNLIDNAIKFTPAGGKVDVEAGLAADGGFVLAVTDTGMGMAPESIPIALRPFGRLATPLEHSTSGAGFGLPICRRLATLHGALLSVVSEPQKGTTCTIAFPPGRVMHEASAAAA